MLRFVADRPCRYTARCRSAGLPTNRRASGKPPPRIARILFLLIVFRDAGLSGGIGYGGCELADR